MLYALACACHRRPRAGGIPKRFLRGAGLGFRATTLRRGPPRSSAAHRRSLRSTLVAQRGGWHQPQRRPDGVADAVRVPSSSPVLHQDRIQHKAQPDVTNQHRCRCCRRPGSAPAHRREARAGNRPRARWLDKRGTARQFTRGVEIRPSVLNRWARRPVRRTQYSAMRCRQLTPIRLESR